MTIASLIQRGAMSALLVGGLAGASVAPAQDNGGSGSAGAESQAQNTQQELRQLQQRVRKLQKQIREIQQKTLENNPELGDQRDEFRDLVESKMSEEGVDAEADRKRMKEIREKMRGGDVSKEERQKLQEEMQTKRRAMMQARRSAMQDKEVQKKREQLRSDLQSAMKKEDPEAEKLIEEYKQSTKKLREQARSAAPGRGQGGGNQSGNSGGKPTPDSGGKPSGNKSEQDGSN